MEAQQAPEPGPARRLAYPLADAVILVLACAAAAGAYALWQPRTWVGGGTGWDGHFYALLYQRFRADAGAVPPEVMFPFCKRVALPFLAARLPLEPASAFLAINLACGVVAACFTYFAVAGMASRKAAMACALPLVAYFHAPLRFTQFAPFVIDPPVIALYALASYAFVRQRWTVALLALAASSLFKEQGVYFLAAFIAWAHVCGRATLRHVLAWAALLALTLVALKLAQHEPCTGTQLRSAAVSAYRKLSGFEGIVRCAAGGLMVLGAFIGARGNWTTSVRQQPLASLFLALALSMALFGGTDTTRILFTACRCMPRCWLHSSSPQAASKSASWQRAGSSRIHHSR